ncbi:MAG: HAD-IA family hydrolase [Gammaproteobacteria bacterium]|nr:HAD-IA family hydrolase [Gammaproteobacteria bacterium]
MLFDLDGTLADTAPDLGAALNLVLRAHGRDPLSLETVRPWASRGGAALVRLGFGIDDSQPQFASLRDEFLLRYREGIAVRTALFPGIGELLARLEAAGYRWGIVTNKIARLTVPLLDQLGLKARAACVVSGDSVARPKPHADPLLHACALLDCPATRIVYVGDELRDVQAGHGAGMATVIARYGYLQPGDLPDNWGADGIIEHPLELLDWLMEAD